MRRSPSVARTVQAIGRPVFTTREIAILRSATLSATSHALGRMERAGLVASPVRGLWCVPEDVRFTPFALVPYLAGSHHAYVSFLSALHLHGIIEQIPQVLYVATTGHTRLRKTPLGTYSFHRIHPAFFTGFEWYGGRQDFLIASPEKALVDCLYLSSRKGKRFRFLPELDLGGRFSFRRARAWARQIPYERIRRHAERALDSVQQDHRGGHRRKTPSISRS